MTYVSDKDRDVFSNVAKTVADNFVTDELREIHEMAVRLRQILDASINRIDKTTEMKVKVLLPTLALGAASRDS
jgi:hypothetical protein